MSWHFNLKLSKYLNLLHGTLECVRGQLPLALPNLLHHSKQPSAPVSSSPREWVLAASPSMIHGRGDHFTRAVGASSISPCHPLGKVVSLAHSPIFPSPSLSFFPSSGCVYLSEFSGYSARNSSCWPACSRCGEKGKRGMGNAETASLRLRP